MVTLMILLAFTSKGIDKKKIKYTISVNNTGII